MTTNDPLIPPPDFNTTPGFDGTVTIEAMEDYYNFNSISWPTRNSEGEFSPPPHSHILDALARSEGLAPEERVLTTVGANTVAVVQPLPKCDLCGAAEARFDARLATSTSSAKAYMCIRCYDERGSGRLGGGDVHLMTMDEVPPAVRAICDEITKRQGRTSLWANSSS